MPDTWEFTEEGDVIIEMDDISTDNDAQFTEQDKAANIWADYRLKNRYEKDGKVYMMGCTSPNGFGSNKDTVSFIQLAHSTTLWIADWTAARFGEPPDIPDPNLFQSQSGNDWVLLDVFMETPNVTVPADGATPYYRISGTYFFGHKKPTADLTALMAFPRPPWLLSFFNRLVSSKELFKKDLIYPVSREVNPGSQFPLD